MYVSRKTINFRDCGLIKPTNLEFLNNQFFLGLDPIPITSQNIQPKCFPFLFAMISNSLIKHFGDIINKINNLNMDNKSIASLNIKIIIYQYSC